MDGLRGARYTVWIVLLAGLVLAGSAVGPARAAGTTSLFLPKALKPPRPPVITISEPAEGLSQAGWVAEVAGNITLSHPLTQAPRVTVTAGGLSNAFYLPSDAAGDFRQKVPLFAGENTITVTTASDQGVAQASVRVTCTGTEPVLRVQLTWESSVDLDLHLVRPDGAYDALPDDCFWFNPNPDWGPAGSPSLVVEDSDGYGPEEIVLPQPGAGNYTVYVHYYQEPGAPIGPAAQFTLRLWVYGVAYDLGPYTVNAREAIPVVPIPFGAGGSPQLAPQWENWRAR